MAAAARAPAGGGGGQTQTRVPAEAAPAVTTLVPTQTVLHLRGATMQQEAEQEVERRSITWAEDVVDNEGMGRKSSKGLCSRLPSLKAETAVSELG
jgi:protein phosphatase 1 regulatory subunit 11